MFSHPPPSSRRWQYYSLIRRYVGTGIIFLLLLLSALILDGRTVRSLRLRHRRLAATLLATLLFIFLPPVTDSPNRRCIVCRADAWSSRGMHRVKLARGVHNGGGVASSATSRRSYQGL